jgi:hypothetical protein
MNQDDFFEEEKLFGPHFYLSGSGVRAIYFIGRFNNEKFSWEYREIHGSTQIKS